MSEQLDLEAPAPADEGGSDFEAITTQEALDKLIGQRIDRVKKQFADYKDLKAKASKFDELEQANKSELQQAQERLSALENELNTERFNSVRASVAADKGVPASAISGSTKEELEASADELLSWRGTQQSAAKPVAGLKSGATNTGQALDPMERAAQALRQLRRNP